MPKCTPITLKYRRVCAGDLNRIIQLKTRAMQTPSTDVDFGEQFVSSNTWAAVQTLKGKDFFAGTNMNTLVTHIFYIRYRENMTAEWIGYRGENYDIIDEENLEENNAFLALMCNVRGADTQPVNEA